MGRPTKTTANNGGDATINPTRKAPAPSGGRGANLPAFDYNSRAGKSNIGGNGFTIPGVHCMNKPSTTTANNTKKSKVDKLTVATGPHGGAMEPRFETSAQISGTLVTSAKPQQVFTPIMTNTMTAVAERKWVD